MMHQLAKLTEVILYPGDKMRHLNFWLLKNKEKILLKIVEWCQKNNKKIQEIKYEDIVEALASPIRNS